MKRLGMLMVMLLTGGLLLRDTKDIDINVGSGVEAARRA